MIDTDKDTIVRQARNLLDDFNQLDEKTQDKLLNGIKCLLFLQNLANIKKDAEDDTDYLQAAAQSGKMETVWRVET